MTTFDSPDRPLYPVDQSFVLQVRRDSGPAGSLVGRVEHVASGHAANFESVADLIRFIAASIDPKIDQTRAPPAKG